MPLQVYPSETKEGVHVACMEDGKAFRIPLNSFGYHFAFYGVTGTGKTRAAMNLAIKAENDGLNLRVIDIEGEWKNIFPHLVKETVYFDIGRNLRVNPFDLKDLALTKMVLKETVFRGIEQEYSDISPQMNYLLDKCLLISRSIPQLIENVIKHQPETHFPLRNLDLTRTALLTRLNPFSDNEVLRKIFYTSKTSLDINSIEDKNMVFDLHSLDMKVAYKRELTLIYNVLALTYLRKALNNGETDQVRNLFIADEAQLLVPKIFRKIVSTDTWTTTDFATRLRKRGESLAIISQSPSNIEDDIRKNSQNIFVFRLQDPSDIKTIAGMFGYVQTDEINHLSNMVTKLENRTAIAKTPAIPFPFVVRTLDLELTPITENELSKHLVDSETIDEEILGEDEKELLQNINEKPFLNNTERALSLGWHRSRFSKVRKSLLKTSLVEEASFKTKLKGAPSHFLKSKGRDSFGRGEFIHAYWVDKIYNFLKEKGYEPQKEYRINDKFVDLAYRKNGCLACIEVEYKSDWKNNILRASKLCNKLVSVFIREQDIIDVIKFVKENNLSNVIITDIYYAYNDLG